MQCNYGWVVGTYVYTITMHSMQYHRKANFICLDPSFFFTAKLVILFRFKYIYAFAFFKHQLRYRNTHNGSISGNGACHWPPIWNQMYYETHLHPYVSRQTLDILTISGNKVYNNMEYQCHIIPFHNLLNPSLLTHPDQQPMSTTPTNA